MTSQKEGEMDDATGGGEENDVTGSDITMRGGDVTEARKKMTS